jgi:hypothetical protein
VLLAMVVAGVSLAMRNPVQVLGGGGCPTRRLAGVYCPGCGTLRATHHLLNGRIVDAWRHNPAMLVAGIPCVLWLAVSNTLAVISGPTRRNPAALGVPTWLLWFAGAALLGWGVVRNLPAPALDWTRPPDPASPAP